MPGKLTRETTQGGKQDLGMEPVREGPLRRTTQAPKKTEADARAALSECLEKERRAPSNSLEGGGMVQAEAGSSAATGTAAGVAGGTEDMSKEAARGGTGGGEGASRRCIVR